MALVSQAAFAGMHDVSRKTVTKWKSQGRVVLDGDKVDVDKSDALLRDGGLGRFGERKRPSGPTEKPKATPERKRAGLSPADARPASHPKNDTGPLPDLDKILDDADAYIQAVTTGDYASQAQAERIKENALALKHVLDVRERAGLLVEMAIAEKVLFELARADRDAWLNWPARIGPLLAAELGIEADRVTNALEAHVRKHLDDLGEPEPDFSGES